MEWSITFVNNKVGEPTVAFANDAEERKERSERIVLVGVITLVVVLFISTFITVGFFVSRDFWEPLSATLDNGMSVYKPRTFSKLSVYDAKSEVFVKTSEDSNGQEKGTTELRPEFPPADKAKADFHRPNVAGLRLFPVYEPVKDDSLVQRARKKGSLHRPNVVEHKLPLVTRQPVPRRRPYLYRTWSIP